MSSAQQRAAREAYWRALWQTRDWRSAALWPLSVLFAGVARLRRVAYRRGWLAVTRAPVPVLVVGGIMIGGVGKTPVVAHVVQALRHAGFRPAVISRGYAAHNSTQPRPVLPDSLPHEVGDEPMVLALKTQCPVWVGRRRGAVALAACAAHPECDVLVCDDGLQHYALARDIEVLVMDARGVGNGWTLPAGPLRESPTRLNEVDAVIWHFRGDAHAVPTKLAPHFVLKSGLGQAYDVFDATTRQPLAGLAGQNALALAGIAQPEVFFNMLAEHGVVARHLPLPDHFEFDAAFLAAHVLAHHTVVMTEKDAVKVRHLLPQEAGRFWVVPLELQSDVGLAAFTDWLVQRLHQERKL
ncbi:MAG: tetraacyldisaccharide 4'-kinase [Formosimonas sp.]